jgi:diketogulonate reductase-like aldo/keto reductase
MPQISAGTWQYNDTVAADSIHKALAAGFTHIDTAENYRNQVGVGKALKSLPRDSYFLTTKTTPCAESTEAACEAQSTKEFLQDLTDLGLDYVDLILLHGASVSTHTGSCDPAACTKDRGQWKAYEKLYKAGKAKAIGVSNYCVSCFECLIGQPGVTVVPAVNQIQYHVGLGPDPAGILSFGQKHGYPPATPQREVRSAACTAALS